ncbi:MAG: hypothetical protein ACRESI_06535 [Gammaproteobacteria bacterium]
MWRRKRLRTKLKRETNPSLSALAKQARDKGELFFSTGKPCQNGHVSKRYASGGGCLLCIYLEAHPRSRIMKTIEQQREYNRLRAHKRTDKMREYAFKKYHTDIQLKLRSNLRSRIKHALHGRVKSQSALKYLGCTVAEAKAYIEKQFQPGMTWANHTHTGWHIDHIIPLASFDMTSEDQRCKAFHYTNLQPLWAPDNLSKNRKLSKSLI